MGDPFLQNEVKNELIPPKKHSLQPVYPQIFDRMNTMQSEASGHDKTGSPTPNHTKNEAKVSVRENSPSTPPELTKKLAYFPRK